MAGTNTTSQLANSVNAIRAKAIYTMQDPGVFPGVFDQRSVPSGNRSFTEPKIPALTAYDLTEGVDMAQAQQLADSLITITPNEIGVQVIYTRLMSLCKSEDVVDVFTRTITDALKKARDVDGTEQLDNYSISLGSGSGTTLTRGYLGAARARIEGGSEPTQEALRAVVHPYTFNDLVDQVSDGALTNSGTVYIGLAGLPEEWARSYVKGVIAGLPIMTDANIAIGSNAAKGGVFAKRANVYVELWGLDIEDEKDASLRGTEINGTMCYAYGERTDVHGVELNLGATAPTA